MRLELRWSEVEALSAGVATRLAGRRLEVDLAALRTLLSPDARLYRRMTATERASSAPIAMLKIRNRRRSRRTCWTVAPNASHTKHRARPLVEVACDAGFADQAHFTRTFKAAFGLTPARYRAMRAGRTGPRPDADRKRSA